MAEAPNLYAESLEKLDQELTCPICLKHFEEPKVLQCCHYYCRECIVQLRARTRGKSDYFQCPECRMEIRLPGDDPESLPTAFFVNRMKEVFSTMQKVQGKVELTCEHCNRATTPVEAFCRHCALFICQYCEEAHRTMKSFSDHVVVSLDDLRQNTAAHLPVKEETQMRCKEHGGKKMKLYCYDCKQLICRDCIVIDHKGHEYNFVNKAAVQCRASLKESVAPLRETQVNVSQALKKVESMESRLDSNSTTAAMDIDRSVDELISLLEKHRRQLHREADMLVEDERKNLIGQKKNIQLATAEIQSLLDFVDHKSQQASDQEVLRLQKQITDRAEEVAQKYDNQVGPTDVPCLEVQFSKEIGGMVKRAISISGGTVVKGPLIDSGPTLDRGSTLIGSAPTLGRGATFGHSLGGGATFGHAPPGFGATFGSPLGRGATFGPPPGRGASFGATFGPPPGRGASFGATFGPPPGRGASFGATFGPPPGKGATFGATFGSGPNPRGRLFGVESNTGFGFQ